MSAKQVLNEIRHPGTVRSPASSCFLMPGGRSRFAAPEECFASVLSL